MQLHVCLEDKDLIWIFFHPLAEVFSEQKFMWLCVNSIMVWHIRLNVEEQNDTCIGVEMLVLMVLNIS